MTAMTDLARRSPAASSTSATTSAPGAGRSAASWFRCATGCVASTPTAREAWLSARAARTLRERDELLARLNTPGVPGAGVAATSTTCADRLSRLLVDIAHHHQRVHDLAYDDVELEIGGSE